jgi:NTE family protein
MQRITSLSSFPIFFLLIFISLSGCTSLGKIENQRMLQVPAGSHGYSFHEHSKKHPSGETLIFMAFSGGGTRAAALSYGVLEALRDTTYQKQGHKVSLLDDVDRISSVSGGSFTAAYYGLFGDRIFKDFKEEFLYMDVQGKLTDQFLRLSTLRSRVFSSRSYTEDVIDYYDKHIFKGKTFADLEKADGPFIMVNATDLNNQSVFTFTQPQFDFLCSDLSSFKIARAVAASSAVPVLFEPVLIENFHDCNFTRPDWLTRAESRARENEDERLEAAVRTMDAYLDRDNPPYVTLIDGGITDNLGLRSLYRDVQFMSDRQETYEQLHDEDIVKRLVIILVNASTNSENTIGTSRELPSIMKIVRALSDIPLHLYSTETKSLLKEGLEQWARELSTAEDPITSYFIELDFTDIQDPEERDFFNNIPTSFVLEKDQVDHLIKLAGTLLRQNKNYQRLLRDL